jgi:hypothetical protein
MHALRARQRPRVFPLDFDLHGGRQSGDWPDTGFEEVVGWPSVGWTLLYHLLMAAYVYIFERDSGGDIASPD